jgi:hypothetical protein
MMLSSAAWRTWSATDPHPHGGGTKPGGGTWGAHGPQRHAEARRRRPEGAMLKELPKSYNVGRATTSRLAVLKRMLRRKHVLG